MLWALLVISICSAGGCDTDDDGQVIGLVGLGDAEPGARSALTSMLQGSPVLSRLGGSYAEIGSVPADVAVIAAPASLVTSLDGWRCETLLLDPKGAADEKLITRKALKSIDGLRGHTVAIDATTSAGGLALIGALARAGLTTIITRNPERAPGVDAVGIAITGDSKLASIWFQQGLVQGHVGAAGDGAQQPLPNVPAVICDRGEKVITDTVVSKGEQLLALPAAVAAHWSARGAQKPMKPALVFGKPGDEPGTIGHPDGIAINRDGTVFVADDRQRRVHVFSAEGKWLRSFGGRGIGRDKGEFGGAIEGIAINPKGEVLVADPGNARIAVFSAAGEFQRAFGHRGTGSGSLIWPSGLAVAPDGSVFVADRGRNIIAVFSADGTFEREIGETGRGKGQLMGPESLAVAPDGALFVADEGNGRIQVFDGEGNLVRAFGDGDGAGSFVKDVEGLAFDGKGRLWAIDEDAGRIRAYTAEGQYLGYVGNGVGSRPGEMISPDGLAYHPMRNLLYVVDQDNFRVQAFSPSDLVSEGANAAATESAEGDQVLVFGRIGKSKRQMQKYVGFAKAVAEGMSAKGTKWSGRVKPLATIDEAMDALRSGRVDFLAESSIGAFELIERGSAKPLLAAAKKGSSSYRSIVFTKKGGVKKLADLSGKTVAFEDDTSTSGFLVPYAAMHATGLSLSELTSPTSKPAGSAVGFRFAGDEETIAGWVFSGRADAGAFSTLDMLALGELAKSFQVIFESAELVNQIVIVRASMSGDATAQLREILLSLPSQANGAATLKPTKLTRFFALDDAKLEAAFANAREAYKEVHDALWAKPEPTP